MDFTINCTRVPIPAGTLFEGVPVEIGPAPALPGLESDHTSPREDNDGAALNLSGRVVSDGKDKRPKQLFKCRKYTILSTLNTRTLQPKGRLQELAHCAKTTKIDIIAIQEHRFFHPDVPIQYHNAGTYQLITSSATKNTSGATVGGVRRQLLRRPAMRDRSSALRQSSRQARGHWLCLVSSRSGRP